MNVFVIGARGFPGVQGGIEKHCEELYPRMAEREDVDITVLSISGYKSGAETRFDRIKFKYINSIRSKSFEKLYYGLKASLYAILQRPDIVHVQGLNCGIFIPVLKLFGLKIVYTQHSRDYLYPKWGRAARFIWRLSERSALMADRVIAVSHALNEHLKKYTDRSLVIHNGIDIKHYNIEKNEEEGYLRKYGLSKNGYLFFAGRFTEEKAIEDLIEAYTRLDLINIKLVIAGDADHESDYSLMVKELALRSDRIILTGFISGVELQALYSNAKLFVLPSKHEVLSFALLEALSYGIEVLASDIEANLQIDLGPENFFVQGDVNDLAGKIHYHLNNSMLDEERKRRLKLLEVDYNWDMVVEMNYNVYVSVL